MAQKIYGKRWKIIEPIGEGGQGFIYKVQDINDENKIYVLKKLKNTNRINRFRSEIETIKTLKHPNIVNLIDFDLDDSNRYLVTDYCAGGELTFDKVSKLSTIEKLKLFSKICKAIGFAHEKGIIHRDIKPANILLQSDDKTPIVTDFGICFNTEEGLERLTGTIEQVGARYYMAPELADGRAEMVKPTSDVYSLGKLLYWMFSEKVMARENFKDNEWDLRKNNSSDHSLYFIYDIFEKTIVEKPIKSPYEKSGGRISNANELADEIDKITYILEQNGRYLDINIAQKCVFCAVGKYEIYAVPTTPTTHSMTSLYGKFPNYQNTDSFCLVCDNCGNIQFFNKSTGGNSWKMSDNNKFRYY